MRFEEREDGIVVVCAGCRRAYARISEKGLSIESRHGHKTDTNTLTPAELRRLAEIAERLGENVLK